ncbi:MAG: hypothetical protein QOH56_4338 [Pseudonocardiales bacterium]|jgi:hypothetical protein|nr:hypothetical protein [Pseudonocardiales bacterium]
MIDQRLKSILEAKGQWNADGVSRKARGRICRRCQRPVMVGLDADLGGMPTACDLTPLTPMGEVAALFNGQPTFSLEWLFDHYEIDFRDSHRILGSPAGSSPKADVLALHRCDTQFNESQTADSKVINPNIEKGATPDECPF